ncbi:MAG: class I adenylate-forming enzyme family protein [Acidimicrobiales bacterium]
MKLHPPERVAEYTARGWWSEETIDGLFRARVAERPDALAVVDPPNKEGAPLRWTWTDLDDAVDRLAAALRAGSVGPGDVVGVQLPNSVELVAAFLAIVRLGAVVCPFPVQFREHELGQLGRLAGLGMFITNPTLRPRIEACDLGVAILDARAAGADPAPAPVATRAADPNECVTICWTSGTESAPKGVPRSHYDWLAVSRATAEAPALTGEDVVLNPFPMVNMAGIGGMLLPWLRVGATLVQHQPFDLPTFLSQVATERVTYTVAPPALLTLLLQREELLASTDISSLRVLGSGSAPLPPAMVKGWEERHGVPVINFFGSNEGVALLSDPVNIPDPEERARYFPRYGAEGISWSSRVADWMSTRLVDPVTGEEIHEGGRPGELRIKGPTVFAGYLGQADLADPFDEQGFLRTGDLFELAGERLQYLRYVDRAKDLVIRGGMNIAPAELESLLSDHPKISESAAVGLPDDVLGERVCLFAVPAPGQELTLEEVVGFLRERRIASYKLPERLEVVEELPRNAIGKVLKRELRRRLATEPSAEAAAVGGGGRP